MGAGATCSSGPVSHGMCRPPPESGTIGCASGTTGCGPVRPPGR
ncbi:hypothetical protein ACFQY7_22290 [Actinomadura luteofluorescens]